MISDVVSLVHSNFTQHNLSESRSVSHLTTYKLLKWPEMHREGISIFVADEDSVETKR